MGDKGFWSGLFQGTDSDGEDVSARFGEGPKEGETLLSDGHRTEEEFTGPSRDRGHDHYDGKGGGTDRGRYTGKGS